MEKISRKQKQFLKKEFSSNLLEVGDCLVWQGATDACGYGKYSRTSKWFSTRAAHRIHWFLNGKKIAKGKELDHLCKNRKCVKIEHLRCVSHKVNILASNGWAAKHANKKRAPCGHLYDGTTGRGDRKVRRCLPCYRMMSLEAKARYRARCRAKASGKPIDDRDKLRVPAGRMGIRH